MDRVAIEYTDGSTATLPVPTEQELADTAAWVRTQLAVMRAMGSLTDSLAGEGTDGR